MTGAAPRDNLLSVDETSGRTVSYDQDCDTYHSWCDDGSSEPVSTALLLTVSPVLEVDPNDLETLSERIEPDALNALVSHWRRDKPQGGDGSISFTFSECTVTNYANGELVIDPARQYATPTGN